MYLDKPMRNHTLMLTIARANRVFPGKHSGIIVDYANVFASLEKALAFYGAGKGGANPVKDKARLGADLRSRNGRSFSLIWKPFPARVLRQTPVPSATLSAADERFERLSPSRIMTSR